VWERSFGVEIGTLDNPGWSLKVDLTDTPLAGWAFDRRETHRTEHDGVVCWVEEAQFNAACGPLNPGGDDRHVPRLGA
jgi:Immunity protein 53